MPYARTRRDQRAKVSWQIRIETAQATRDLVVGDDGAAATAAQVSLGLIKKLGDSLAGEIRTYASVCEAIVAGDKDQVYELLCQRQIKDPLRHRHLRTMLSLMPGELNEETRLTTRAVFVALADALAHERSSSEPVYEPAR